MTEERDRQTETERQRQRDRDRETETDHSLFGGRGREKSKQTKKQNTNKCLSNGREHHLSLPLWTSEGTLAVPTAAVSSRSVYRMWSKHREDATHFSIAQSGRRVPQRQEHFVLPSFSGKADRCVRSRAARVCVWRYS